MSRGSALLLFGVVGARLASAELDPVPPGVYAVATSNLEVVASDSGPMFDHLNGKTSKQGTLYLTDILVHPEAVPTLQVEVPANPKIYGAQAGTRRPLVLLIVYPTTKNNPRPDYKYPYKETGDRTLTHMAARGDKPIFANATAKYPLIVYTGGYNTHGLWHLFHLKELAAHGYIVVDMFHGDGRDAAIGNNLALRSLDLRATLDFILAHPDYGPAIDADRIGIDGESAGGHTVAAALGGTDPAGRLPGGADLRVKAGFGLIPFMGGQLGIWPFKMDLWYFGEDHAGLRTVQRPYFAVYGEKDSNLPPEGVEAAVRKMAGSTWAVLLEGENHSLTNAANSDIRTWEVLFFDAWLRDDATAQEKLKTGFSVRGGVRDRKTYQHGTGR